MSLSKIVETSSLHANRKFVMPAKAGIQCGGVWAKTQNLDSRFRGKDGASSRLPVRVMKSLGCEPKGRLIRKETA